MNIGYAQERITPSLDRPVFLAGFGNNRRAQTVHDDLYVRALALQDERPILVLVALDLIGFFRMDCQAVVRQVDRPDVSILIASTHTHHGPDTMGLWGPDDKTHGVDPVYLEELRQKIVDTIHASLTDLQPASAKWASVHVPGLVKNARNPEIVDDELTLAQFVSGDRVLATLFNFPCHPEVLWEHNPHISADYPGYLRRAVEAQTGAPCIFFSGALGGMLTPDVKDHTFEEAEHMGTKLAEQGLQALARVEPRAAQIDFRQQVVQARLTNILYKLAFRRKLLPDGRDSKGYVHTEVSLMKLGGLWFAAVPGEMLPKLGLQLKAWMKDAGAEVTGVIGLANDELGYILPAEDFKYPWNPFRPGKHYEETNSISKEIGPRVMEGIRSLL